MSTFEKLKTSLRKVIYSEGVNPLPTKIMLIVYMLNFFNSMVMTMVFSFLPRMVKSFDISELEMGYYAGLLGSSLFISRTFFSAFWGYFADNKGSKFSLLVAVGGLMASTLAFGFSTDFYWAWVTRFLQGAFMGIIVITKAILANACDDTNFSLGLSILISSFSVGLVIGPSLAGFLVFPAEQYPGTFARDGIFGRFSVLLPMLVLTIGFFIPFALSIIYLPSDQAKKEEELTRLIPAVSKQHTSIYNAVEERSNEQNDAFWVLSLNHRQSNERIEHKNNFDNTSSFQLFDKIKADVGKKKESGGYSIAEFKQSKLFRIVTIKECMLSCLLYGSFSFIAVGQSELFPLFAATSSNLHGLSFDTSEIGLALLIASVVLIVVQLTVLPRVNDYFGSRKTLIICTCAMTFSIPMLPCMPAIQNKYLFWICLSLQLLVVRGFVTLGYLAINILLNNSVTPDLLGTANGFAMTCASIGRMIAPTVFGSLYSWSLKHLGGYNTLGFPFNQFFAFLILSLCAILISLLASFLPHEMDRRREDDNTKKKNVEEDDEYLDETTWRRTNVIVYEF